MASMKESSASKELTRNDGDKPHKPRPLHSPPEDSETRTQLHQLSSQVGSLVPHIHPQLYLGGHCRGFHAMISWTCPEHPSCNGGTLKLMPKGHRLETAVEENLHGQ